MKSIINRAETRGHANYGWLHTWHTFSFARYYEPQRMQFGALRVLNDDMVEPGKGFHTHAHDNMEIISIPLSGALAHKDSAGHEEVIKAGDVQVMSAGTGITHSEYNASQTEKVNFLQIWIFPAEQNIPPRYDQKTFPVEERKNRFQTVVSPHEDDALTIRQNAWLSLAHLSAGVALTYDVRVSGNGVYLFVIERNIEIKSQKLNRRDGMGVWETDSIDIKAESDAEILLIEVPME